MEELPVNDPSGVTEWMERFEQMSEIHESIVNVDVDAVKAVRKRALFINSIGKEAYSLLRSYLAPELLSTKSLAQLKACITTNLVPQPSLSSESYKLSQLRQETNETISLFLSRVKAQAAKCDYGQAFDRIVKDKFICGVRSEKLRSTLLNDPAVTTSATALQKAIAHEASHSAAHEMNCNAVRRGQGSQNYQTDQGRKSYKRNDYEKKKPKSYNDQKTTVIVCKKCTLRGHEANDCHTKCRKCKGIGHIAKFCQKRGHAAKHVSDVGGDGADHSRSEEEEVDMGYVHRIAVSERVDQMVDTVEYSTGEIGAGKNKLTSDVTSNVEICNEIQLVSETRENENSNSISIDSNVSSNIVGSMINELSFSYNSRSTRPLIKVLINGKYVSMELDTGATVTCMSHDTFNRLGFSGTNLEPSNMPLRVANGTRIDNLQKTVVTVSFKGILQKLLLYVVDSAFPTLFGREWIEAFFGKNWLSRLTDIEANQIQSDEDIRQELIAEVKKSDIFKPGLGTVVGYEACLDLKENHRPKFCKARSVPFAIKEKLGKELDRMEEEGTLQRVDFSEYASPVVPIIKKDKSVRICGDYKTTVNPNLDTKVYPLPLVEDCFAEMSGGVKFTKLDIKSAYNNLKLREQDQILTTINTHQGLYKWKRLPYGISSSSGIFQSTMDNVLKGLRGVTCRVDDILITGSTTEEHVQRVREVVKRLDKAGFRCGWEKSEFLMDKVVYLSYEVTKEGVKPLRSKVETIVKAKYPENLPELISFLGACQYYGRFIPDMSTLIEPLNQLRTAKVWKFGAAEKKSFDELKKLMASERVLTFYTPNLPIRVDCDASKYGIGAVLSHVDEQGRD